jgi:hypothetical protein
MPDQSINISNEKIRANYFNKLQSRCNPNDYPFDNTETVFTEIIENLERVYDAKPVSIIHGDFWFSNILLTYSENIQCLDMRGQVDHELTLNGDMYYDYGKMYQSILGYDLILNKKEVSLDYKEKINDYFLKKCIERGLNIEYLHWVTMSLIFGSFYYLPSNISKKDVWNWFTNILHLN